jgi:hypothetical protein
VEKYGRTRQATGDNIRLRMRFACWTTRAADGTLVTLKSHNVTFVRTLSVLLNIIGTHIRVEKNTLNDRGTWSLLVFV